MALLRRFLVLIIAAVASCNVIDMSTDFETKIRGSGVTLVKFYAPWCGHCKHLAPIFKEASDKNKSPGTFAEVDCTTDGGRKACEKYGVGGYPTVKLFRNGQVVEDYSGPRDVASLLRYIDENSAAPIVEITTVQEYTDLLESPKQLNAILFGYFTKAEHELLEALKRTANEKLSKVRFAFTTDRSVVDHSGFTDKIVLHLPALFRSPKIESPHMIYEGPAEMEEIDLFVTKNKHGNCGLRKKDNSHEFPAPVVVAYMSIDLEKDPKAVLYVRNRMVKAAKQLADKFGSVTFAISDSSDFYRELADAGIEVDKQKVSVIGFDKENRKYKMHDKFGVDTIVSFVTKMMEGKLEPTVKSEPIPKEPIDEGLQVVVAKNFDEIVMKSDKDVFIEFYAPWCGHCKKLAPVLTSLAEKMKDNADRLLIAKMNAADNEVFKPFEVEGFPTLYFIPKNDKKNPIKYEGGRKLEDFIEYLREHSTEPLVGYEPKEPKIPEKEL